MKMWKWLKKQFSSTPEDVWHLETVDYAYYIIEEKAFDFEEKKECYYYFYRSKNTGFYKLECKGYRPYDHPYYHKTVVLKLAKLNKDNECSIQQTV